MVRSFALREFSDYGYEQKLKIHPLRVAAGIQNKRAKLWTETWKGVQEHSPIGTRTIFRRSVGLKVKILNIKSLKRWMEISKVSQDKG